MEFKGAVFDLDGVITQTAKTHFKAWKKVFDDFIKKENESEQINEFTYEDDYIPYVDGKPRYQGVKAFLESRDIKLAYGEPEDDEEKKTICGIGNKKNEIFRGLVSSEGVEIYDDTVDFIKELKQHNIKVAVASSSKNCKFILEEVGLVDMFGSIVDGVVSKELNLKGKPEPDIFITAVENMELAPADCIMVEDALAGVEAGKNGNFGYVIGISKSGKSGKLLSYGADIVLKDFADFGIEDCNTWFTEGLARDAWQLQYYGFDPAEERLREALTTCGNGYFASRGSFPFEKINDDVHYPGTYIAGIYNKIPTKVHGKKIYNNAFVNCPNWLLLEFNIGNQGFSSPLEQKIIQYRHTLDIKYGVLEHSVIFEDSKGRRSRLETERFVSMDNPHRAALMLRFTPLNYSDNVQLRSSLDGTVINYGVERYRDLKSKHLEPVREEESGGRLHLEVKTSASGYRIYLSSLSELLSEDGAVDAGRDIEKSRGKISEVYTFAACESVVYSFFKHISIFTGRDREVEEPSTAVRNELAAAQSYDSMLQRHKSAWDELWNVADIKIDGDRFSQKTSRLYTYHLFTTAAKHNTDIDAGLPARGLHGEAYRGHVFWDEIFIAPFYNLRFPEITRAHLMYRCRRLNGARKNAINNGYSGAMYPWQTADTGSEESQIIHYNPQSGEWDPDLSQNQRHISISIAYNIWNYFYCSGDEEFINDHGMEMLLEISRFWASIARYDEETGRYHISGVMGPDEFHEKYPGAEKGGFTDNAYTNIAAAWLLHKVIETYEHRPEDVQKRLRKSLNLSEAEMQNWKNISEKLNIVVRDNGIISQFDGWMELKELDWDRYKDKYEDINRMDRILKAEGDSPNKYKVIKQADVLMTYYILAPEQVSTMLDRMGYKLGDPRELLKKNYNYYIARCSNGSTLSYVVHSAVLKYLQSMRNTQWKWFMEALKSDVYDTQGGTTPEGIHCGVMAGSIDIILTSFAGINLFRDKIVINPRLPAHWKKIAFTIQHQASYFDLCIDQSSVCIKPRSGYDDGIAVEIKGKHIDLLDQKETKIAY